MVNQNGAEWATARFGRTSGNIAGEIWVCGVDDDGDVGELSLADAAEGGACQPASSGNGVGDCVGNGCNESIRTILAAMAGDDDDKNYFNQKCCFVTDANYFKLNLYPFAFRRLKSWETCSAHVAGFANKDEYRAACRKHRFPALKALAYSDSRRPAPKVIVCTGAEFGGDFFRAFGNDGRVKEVGGSDIPVWFTVANAGQTLVVLTREVHELSGTQVPDANAVMHDTGRLIARVVTKNGLSLNYRGRSVPADATK